MVHTAAIRAYVVGLGFTSLVHIAGPASPDGSGLRAWASGLVLRYEAPMSESFLGESLVSKLATNISILIN